MKKLAIGTVVILASTLNLAGCGGGSSVASIQAATVVTSFPLQSGFKALLASGLQKTFSISGTCSGSGSKTASPSSTAATFEGSVALSSTNTLTMSFKNCPLTSIAETFTTYVDSNYSLLGFNNVGVNYGVYLTRPIIPTSVSVGSTAIIGTQNLYTDSTKKTGIGTQVSSYVVQADTSSTAIINFISKILDQSGTVIVTGQDFYRIDAMGKLTPITSDIQINGQTTHFLLTYN